MAQIPPETLFAALRVTRHSALRAMRVMRREAAERLRHQGLTQRQMEGSGTTTDQHPTEGAIQAASDRQAQ